MWKKKFRCFVMYTVWNKRMLLLLLLKLKLFPFQWLPSLMEKVSLHFLTQIFKVRRCVWKGASHFRCHIRLWTLPRFKADRGAESSFTQIRACKGERHFHCMPHSVFAVYQTSAIYRGRYIFGNCFAFSGSILWLLLFHLVRITRFCWEMVSISIAEPLVSGQRKD